MCLRIIGPGDEAPQRGILTEKVAYLWLSWGRVSTKGIHKSFYIHACDRRFYRDVNGKMWVDSPKSA